MAHPPGAGWKGLTFSQTRVLPLGLWIQLPLQEKAIRPPSGASLVSCPVYVRHVSPTFPPRALRRADAEVTEVRSVQIG